MFQNPLFAFPAAVLAVVAAPSAPAQLPGASTNTIPSFAQITDQSQLSFRQAEWNYGTDTSWQRWWALERERFIDLRQVARRGADQAETEIVGGAWASRVEDTNAPTRAQKEYLIHPGLMRLKEEVRDLDVQSEALIALGRVSMLEESSVQMLREYLCAPSQDLVQSAVLSLGLLGDEITWSPLRSLMTDDANGRWLTESQAGVPTTTRVWAALATGIGISQWEESARAQATAALLKVAQEATSHPELQSAAVIALGMTPPTEGSKVFDSLLGMMTDKSLNQSVRAVVPTAFARSAEGNAARTQIAREELLRQLTSRNAATVRQGAIRALALVPETDLEAEPLAVAALTKLARKARTPEERHFAALSLAETAAQTKNIKQIEKIAGELVKQLKDRSSEHAGWAALALGVIGYEQPLWGGTSKVRAERALLKHLVDGNAEEMRGACAIAMGLIGQTSAAPALMEILEDDGRPSLRGHAAVALGLIGHQDAETGLLQQLASSAHRPALLEQTTIGLALLGSDELHGRLLCMLAPTEGPLPTQAEVAAASRGIALIGNARTAPFLISAMDDDKLTHKSRAFAARALGYLADADSTPWQLRMTRGLHHLAVPNSVLDWESGNGVLDRR
ncbi:MAG: HEAT repeat domain-containing protein [Planctomycetes bacterium]|nr:HEAT repeat domain-containing protein [Planctomycetota bacterium]